MGTCVDDIIFSGVGTIEIIFTKANERFELGYYEDLPGVFTEFVIFQGCKVSNVQEDNDYFTNIKNFLEDATCKDLAWPRVRMAWYFSARRDCILKLSPLIQGAEIYFQKICSSVVCTAN